MLLYLNFASLSTLHHAGKQLIPRPVNAIS